mgnify:CR=1 FL=1
MPKLKNQRHMADIWCKSVLAQHPTAMQEAALFAPTRNSSERNGLTGAVCLWQQLWPFSPDILHHEQKRLIWRRHPIMRLPN